MPCNGVAVALGRIANVDELTRQTLETLPAEIVNSYLTGFLSKLGYNVEQETDSTWYVTRKNASILQDLGINRAKLAEAFRVKILNGRVEVTSGPYGIEEKIVNLLKGVAARKRQLDTVEKLRKAGVKVGRVSETKNGALVLKVEV